MSEVKRWKLKGFIPGVDGESKAIFQPVVVLAEDFDNATRLFLDAAERCVASERRERELQQSLTAADERNDEAIDLLRRARAVIEGGGWADLERDIAHFFKPAEPARCTNRDRATVEQCDDAGCGFLGAGNGAPE